MSGELFKSLTGVDMTHIPYRGGTPAFTDLLGGQVQMMFIGIAPSRSEVTLFHLRFRNLPMAAGI